MMLDFAAAGPPHIPISSAFTQRVVKDADRGGVDHDTLTGVAMPASSAE